MSNDKPWWWPEIIDDDHIARLRADYPETTDNMDDESVLDCFDDGKTKGQFSITWDHLGDAYNEYEKLASAFLRLVEEVGKSPDDFTEAREG